MRRGRTGMESMSYAGRLAIQAVFSLLPPSTFSDFDLAAIHGTALPLHEDFPVGQRHERGEARVHSTLAAIDEALLVELDEHALEVARIVRVHHVLARHVWRRDRPDATLPYVGNAT